MKHLLLLAALIGVMESFSGCSHWSDRRPAQASVSENNSPSGDQAFQNKTINNGRLAVCGAIRGNGAKIFSTLSAMAEYSGHYGELNAVAGASSGSIASFLYESIVLNPLIHKCGQRECTGQEVGARIGLALKSFQGYLTQLENSTTEGKAVAEILALKTEFSTLGITKMLEQGEFFKARDSVLALWTSPRLRKLINPEIFKMLQEPKVEKLATNLKLIYRATTSTQNMNADSVEVLFRAGLIDTKELAREFADVGDFYAGYGVANQESYGRFLDLCAVGSVDVTWTNLIAKNASCTELLNLAITAAHEQQKGTHYKSRGDEIVGRHLPALISVSTINSTAQVAKFNHDLVRFNAHHSTTYKPDFQDFRVGYWGTQSALQQVSQNVLKYADLKTNRFYPLGEDTWVNAMFHSISEPGLAHMLPYGTDVLTFGGWVDGHSTLVLKNLGCENVVYFSRKGEESKLPQSASRLLGASASEVRALADITNAQSSYALAVRESEGVWCTDWNNQSPTQLEKMIVDGATAPFYTRGSYFQKSTLLAYKSQLTTGAPLGCSNAP